MDLAEMAEQAKLVGDMAEYGRLAFTAFEKESQAALQLASETALEPSRSVLFRSAAVLALECQETREAERLISAALAGTPPAEIADELRDLLEDVYFHRHLSLRGLALSPREVQMTLEGEAVGFGIAPSEAFTQRVKDLETLLYRTVERRLGREFREAGRRKKDLAANIELYMSVPRAASFAVTLRLGQSEQLRLPGQDLGAEALSDLLDGLSKVNDGDLVGLTDSIPDEPYRLNFIALAEKLAPDGKAVRTVGFTSMVNDEERVVALVTSKQELRERKLTRPLVAPHDESTDVEIRGVLLEADATRQKHGEIEVVDEAGAKHKILVPRGMMSDIVKPMFEEEVVIRGQRRGEQVHLATIFISDAEDEVADGD